MATKQPATKPFGGPMTRREMANVLKAAQNTPDYNSIAKGLAARISVQILQGNRPVCGDHYVPLVAADEIDEDPDPAIDELATYAAGINDACDHIATRWAGPHSAAIVESLQELRDRE